MIPDAAPPKRLLPLDGLRGIAILVVFIFHYIPNEVARESILPLRLCAHALRMSWIGVDLFFVLSGFLITGILLDQSDAKNLLNIFYIRRFFRIFPVYFLVLLTFVSLLPTHFAAANPWLFAHVPPTWAFALFLQNIFMGFHGNYGGNWLAVTWSLAVEEQFYLLLPVAILTLSRRNLAMVIIVFTMTAPLLRSVWPGFHSSVNLPWRCDSLLPGAILALLVRRAGFLETIRPYRDLLLAAIGILFVGVLAMTSKADAFGSLTHLWLAGFFAVVLLLTILDQEAALGESLSHPALTWLGTRSYGIYMYHQIVAGLMHAILMHRSPQLVTPADATVTGLSVLVTLGLAELSFRYFELPLQRIGHQFKYQKHIVPPILSIDTALPAI